MHGVEQKEKNRDLTTMVEAECRRKELGPKVLLEKGVKWTKQLKAKEESTSKISKEKSERTDNGYREKITSLRHIVEQGN